MQFESFLKMRDEQPSWLQKAHVRLQRATQLIRYSTVRYRCQHTSAVQNYTCSRQELQLKMSLNSNLIHCSVIVAPKIEKQAAKFSLVLLKIFLQKIVPCSASRGKVEHMHARLTSP